MRFRSKCWKPFRFWYVNLNTTICFALHVPKRRYKKGTFRCLVGVSCFSNSNCFLSSHRRSTHGSIRFLHVCLCQMNSNQSFSVIPFHLSRGQRRAERFLQQCQILYLGGMDFDHVSWFLDSNGHIALYSESFFVAFEISYILVALSFFFSISIMWHVCLSHEIFRATEPVGFDWFRRFSFW